MFGDLRKEYKVIEVESVAQEPEIMQTRRSRQSQYSILKSSIPQSLLIQATIAIRV